MPGVEPGSNVYAEGQYDHVLLNSSALSEKNREKGESDDASVGSPSRQSESNLASDVSSLQRGSREKRGPK